MTKQKIKDSLLLTERFAEGKAKNEAHQSDGPEDYHYGKHLAYQDMAERIRILINKLN